MRFIASMIITVTVLFSTKAAVATTAHVAPLALEMSTMTRANNVMTWAHLLAFKRLHRVGFQRIHFANTNVNVIRKSSPWGVFALWFMFLRGIGL